VIADLGTRIAVAAFLIWPTGSCVPAAPVAPVFNPSEQRAGATQRKWSFYLCHRNQFASPVHFNQLLGRHYRKWANERLPPRLLALVAKLKEKAEISADEIEVIRAEGELA